MMDIIMGCDNAAVDLARSITTFLEEMGVNVNYLGAADSSDDTPYPLIAQRVCTQMITSNENKRGILLCGTGIGMCIAANKFKGIRAAVCHDSYSAERSILSNNGNVLCLGARVVGIELAKKIVGEWVGLKFQDGSSTPKVKEIQKIEDANFR